MASSPRSPRMLRGALVGVDSFSFLTSTTIFQYNPDTLTRTLQARGGDSGAGAEVLRLRGAPIETIKLDVEIDATDQLEFPDQNPTTAELGIHPQLAALETIVYPANSQIQSNNRLANSGTLEIIPMETPLTLFIWSKNRVLPVRLTDFSITEEAFDPNLNPIRAKVSLGMRVLSVNDLPFDHKGSSLFMSYHQQKEALAAKALGGSLNALGITRIP